jgi:DNA-binding beta-propeller fold protein YncE
MAPILLPVIEKPSDPEISHIRRGTRRRPPSKLAARRQRGPMSAEVEYSASEAAQKMIASLGRTEDVQFSPSNRRLAIAGFGANRIAVFDIAIDKVAGKKSVVLGDCLEVEAPTLQRPHGLCFLDEDTVAVANREGTVQVLPLPPSGKGAPRAFVAARQVLLGGSGARIDTPGSLAAVPLDDDTLELLVCNNYSHRVTRHVLDRRNDFAATADALLLEKRLDIPDGIAVSGDRRWIAISNHNTQNVLLYDRHRGLHPRSEPDGVLRNVLCPHGVRFTSDLQFILVADASARYVNVYEKGDGSWSGTRDPVRLYPVMAPEVFRRGRHNPQEGGPKGIDLSKDTGVLAVTSEYQPLAFFDVAEIVSTKESPENRLRRYVQWRIVNALFNRLGYMPGAPA